LQIDCFALLFEGLLRKSINFSNIKLFYFGTFYKAKRLEFPMSESLMKDYFNQCEEKLAFPQPMAVFDQTWPLFITYREIFPQRKNNLEFSISSKIFKEKISSKNDFFFSTKKFF